MAKKADKKDTSSPPKPKTKKGNGDGDIDWVAIEKEFRYLHREVMDPDRKRMSELQKLAAAHDRELVISGSQAWMVEYYWEEPEDLVTSDA